MTGSMCRSQGDESIMDVKLYVGNLSDTTTEDDLRTLFAKAGQVTSVALITDRKTGNSKGFGFVEMTTQAEAKTAIEMLNGFDLDGHELKVDLAKPRETQGGGSGRQGGRTRR
jgi:RNA recognition motif-containing protein